jgi:hypothetical protein
VADNGSTGSSDDEDDQPPTPQVEITAEGTHTTDHSDSVLEPRFRDRQNEGTFEVVALVVLCRLAGRLYPTRRAAGRHTESSWYAPVKASGSELASLPPAGLQQTLHSFDRVA